jgi:IS30 family transposase
MPGPRLTLAEREEIVIGHEHGETIEVIAVRVGRCPSTVLRELCRNRPAGGPTGPAGRRASRPGVGGAGRGCGDWSPVGC